MAMQAKTVCQSLTYTDNFEKVQNCAEKACSSIISGGSSLENLFNNNCKDLCRECYDAVVAETMSARPPVTLTTFPPTTSSPSLGTTAESSQGSDAVTIGLSVSIGLVVVCLALFGLYKLYKKASDMYKKSVQKKNGAAANIPLFPGCPENAEVKVTVEADDESTKLQTDVIPDTAFQTA
ncbi:uncharacterized protein LOC135484035 isoform X2 [Lineus longissimus]